MSEEIKDNVIEEEQGEGVELKVSTRSGKVESDICLGKKKVPNGCTTILKALTNHYLRMDKSFWSDQKSKAVSMSPVITPDSYCLKYRTTLTCMRKKKSGD